ncbi:hypothetical protein LRS56_13885 [Pseudomonas poae]|nr:hypothetical protein LRS56_13885 [Pseudomonas poae]
MNVTDIPFRPACAHAQNEPPPHAQAVEQHVLEWTEAQQLATDPDFHSELISSRFGWLAARCYPNASMSLLNTIADFLTWLYLVDDRLFDRAQRIPRAIIADVSALWNVQGQQDKTSPAAPLQNAWRDICTRLLKQMGSVWLHHFITNVRMMYGANTLQIIGQLHKISIDKHAYEILRYHNSGLVPCFDFYGTSVGYQLRDEDRYCLNLQTLSQQANIIIALCNDIHSYAHETRQRGHYENLVCLHVFEGHTLKEALSLVSDTVQHPLNNFDALSEHLFHTSTPAVRRYINELQHWIIGYQYWAFNDTCRYVCVSTNDS